MLLQVELTVCAIVVLPQKKTLHFLLKCQQYQTIRLEFPLTVFIFIYSFTVTIVYCTDPNYSFEINRELQSF